jgi:6-phosphogluconate dehydrogenase
MSDRELADIGVYGMGVMGRNLALNILDHGFTVAVANRSPGPLAAAVAESEGRLLSCPDMESFVGALEPPRRVLLMIKAGAPVDAVIEQLVPLLEPGDVIIDGGNSWFKDTRRRAEALQRHGLHYFGLGVSGGEEGARHGPSLMPGGSKEAYPLIQPILEAIAAKTDSGPCVTYVGADGAGHFVKMVHNGIEYAEMQFLAEVWHLLRETLAWSPERLAELFERWNQGELGSYLIEITARILRVRDPEGQGYLLDKVLDKAGQKGTGRWTAQIALELGVPVPCIAAALDARNLSAMKDLRLTAAKVLRGPAEVTVIQEIQPLLQEAHDTLLAARIAAYGQGFHLIATAEQEYDWSIDPAEIARIWKGGCIIRARLLDRIMAAFNRRPAAPHLMLDPELAELLVSKHETWRRVTALALYRGVPTPALSAGLAYYDSLRLARLPQNLTQAQRDAFGAHTYQRIDDPSGAFVHTDWLQ